MSFPWSRLRRVARWAPSQETSCYLGLAPTLPLPPTPCPTMACSSFPGSAAPTNDLRAVHTTSNRLDHSAPARLITLRPPAPAVRRGGLSTPARSLATSLATPLPPYHSSRPRPPRPLPVHRLRVSSAISCSPSATRLRNLRPRFRAALLQASWLAPSPAPPSSRLPSSSSCGGAIAARRPSAPRPCAVNTRARSSRRSSRPRRRRRRAAAGRPARAVCETMAYRGRPRRAPRAQTLFLRTRPSCPRRRWTVRRIGRSGARQAGRRPRWSCRGAPLCTSIIRRWRARRGRRARRKSLGRHRRRACGGRRLRAWSGFRVPREAVRHECIGRGKSSWVAESGDDRLHIDKIHFR